MPELYTDYRIDDYLVGGVGGRALNPYEFRLIHRIARREGAGNACYESAGNISKRCNISLPIVKRSLKVLESENAVTATKRTGQTTLYSVNPIGKWRNLIKDGTLKATKAKNNLGKILPRQDISQEPRQDIAYKDKPLRQNNSIDIIYTDSEEKEKEINWPRIECVESSTPTSEHNAEPGSHVMQEIIKHLKLGRHLSKELDKDYLIKNEYIPDLCDFSAEILKKTWEVARGEYPKWWATSSELKIIAKSILSQQVESNGDPYPSVCSCGKHTSKGESSPHARAKTYYWKDSHQLYLTPTESAYLTTYKKAHPECKL